MPYSVSLQPAPRRGFVQLSGEATPRTVLEACQELVRTDAWAPGTPQVWDFRAVTRLDVEPDGWAALLEASRRDRALVGDGRVAVVSRNADLAAFLDLYARTFRSTPREFRFASSPGAALAWLDAAPQPA